jgi:uncharacterized membrane protein
MKKATFGLDENIASLCAYAGIFVTGIIFLLFERDNKTVRFHALQSIIWFGFLAVLGIAAGLVLGLISWIPLIGGLVAWVVNSVLGLIGTASWLFLMFKAYQGAEFRIPVIGDAVYNAVNH